MLLTVLIAAMAAQEAQPGGFWYMSEPVRGEGRQYGQFGGRMAFLGDLDADGCDDWISSSLQSYVRVVSGRTGDDIWRLSRGAVGSGSAYYGSGVGAAGDLDADGVPDFLIGVPLFSAQAPRGVVFALSGRTSQVIRSFHPPDNAYRLGGFGIVGGHDFTGDGVPDVLASDQQFNSSSGILYLFDGATAQVVWRRAGTYAGENVGQKIAVIGDADGDLTAEVICHSGSYPVSPGGVDVLDGATGALKARVYGTGDLGWLGLCGAGDADGDGLADFAAIDSNPPGVLVFRGLDGSLLQEFRYGPIQNRRYSVAGGVDLDGDGGPELVVGSPFSLNVRGGLGQVFVQSIRDGRRLAVLGWSAQSKSLGSKVCVGGDLDGDGRPDILTADPGVPRALQVSVGLVVAWKFDPYLASSPRSLSATLGGVVRFEIDFPDQEAGNTYRLLASSVPADEFVLLHGLRIPLGHSLILRRMLRHPPGAFDHPVGTLDALGRATVTLTLAPGLAAPLAGRTLAFAAIAEPTPQYPSRSSGPVFLTIEP